MGGGGGGLAPFGPTERSQAYVLGGAQYSVLVHQRVSPSHKYVQGVHYTRKHVLMISIFIPGKKNKIKEE